MHQFDHNFRQNAEAVMLAFDRSGRQRLLASAA
jgi:hypothetical protein